MLPVAGHEVDPLLVDEQARLGRLDAVARETLGPPAQERPAALADADEAEVEHAGDVQAVLGGLAVVARQRLQRVRREHDAVALRQLADEVQRVEDDDVRVEVQRGRRAGCQHRLEQRRLERRRQLLDVVERQHPLELAVRQPDLVRLDHVERVVVAQQVLVRRVHHQHREAAVGMVLAVGRRHRAGVREVVAGDDRAGVQHGHSTSRASSATRSAIAGGRTPRAAADGRHGRARRSLRGRCGRRAARRAARPRRGRTSAGRGRRRCRRRAARR